MTGNVRNHNASFCSLSQLAGTGNSLEVPGATSIKVRNLSGSFEIPARKIMGPKLSCNCIPQLSPLKFNSRLGSPRTVERRKQKIRQIMENDFEENLFHVKSLTAKKCVKFFGTSQIPLDKLTFNNNNNNTSGEEKLLCAGCAYPLDAHKEAAEQVNIKPWTRDTLRWRGKFF